MSKKSKSTTLWLAVFGAVIVPVSWFVDHWMKMQMIDKLNEIGSDSASSIVAALPNVGIPLGGIVTLATFAISLYTGGRRARDVAKQLSNRGDNSVTPPSP